MTVSGKAPDSFMRGAVYAHLGYPSKEVTLGPARGLDNGVVSVGGGRVMIVTADPISIIPALGAGPSARLSVHLVASDFTTSGVDPEFAVFTYNFPPAMPEAEKELYASSVGEECRRLGVAVVAGHTGSYPGGGFTVIGAGVMMATAAEGGYLAPSMAMEGDAVLMTKHAAIESTMSLAYSFPEFTEKKAGRRNANRAKELLSLCSTVEDARALRKLGVGRQGVTSMHDATEGGVLGALEEMASASHKSFVVDADLIPVPPEVSGVCAAFGIDPLSSMGEGALMLTCRPGAVRRLRRELRGTPAGATVIGRVEKGGGLWVSRGARRAEKYRPGPDPYWGAYERALAQGLG